MTETDLSRQIQLALSDEHTRMWRNTVGQAWIGAVTHLADGSIMIRKPKRVTFGLCPGSADLIGPVSRIVTPQMVGTRVALFGAIEIKTDKGRIAANQQAFVDTIIQLGGLAGIVRSVDEAKKIVDNS